MPILARFYGIVIRMYFRGSEHNPLTFMQSMGTTRLRSTYAPAAYLTGNFQQGPPLWSESESGFTEMLS